MMVDREERCVGGWLWLRRWRSLVPTEFLLLLLFLLLTATLLLMTSANQANILSATPLTQADLDQTRQPLALKGSLWAVSQQRQITELRFVLALAPTASPLDLMAPHLTLRYQDATQQVDNLPWTWHFQNGSNDNSLLEAGEQVQLTVSFAERLTPALGANTPFRLELKAPQRLLFALQRTTPSTLESTMDLQ